MLLFKLSIFGTINFETVFDRSPTGTFVRGLAVKNTYLLCQGGSWNLARGLMETYLAAGGQYRNLTEVSRITLEAGRATGVETADGSRYTARVIASTLGPHQTFGSFVGEGQLPTALVERMRQFRYTSWGLWGAHWALKEAPATPPPPWSR